MTPTTKTTTTGRLIEGLQILNAYPRCETAVGHEQLFSGPSDMHGIAVDHQERLIELGWSFDEEQASWIFNF